MCTRCHRPVVNVCWNDTRCNELRSNGFRMHASSDPICVTPFCCRRLLRNRSCSMDGPLRSRRPAVSRNSWSNSRTNAIACKGKSRQPARPAADCSRSLPRAGRRAVLASPEERSRYTSTCVSQCLHFVRLPGCPYPRGGHRKLPGYDPPRRRTGAGAPRIVAGRRGAVCLTQDQ